MNILLLFLFDYWPQYHSSLANRLYVLSLSCKLFIKSPHFRSYISMSKKKNYNIISIIFIILIINWRRLSQNET